jgi:putrescine importer
LPCRERHVQHSQRRNSTPSFATISAGAAIAAYSFLGFDAVTTLTEETIEPRKNMPRAIMLIALIGGGIFVAVSYVTQLGRPGGVFEDSASAASSIALQIGGQLFGAVFLAGLVRRAAFILALSN